MTKYISDILRSHVNTPQVINDTVEKAHKNKINESVRGEQENSRCG